MEHIFLSYSKADFKIAKRISNDLKSAGLEIWFDEVSLLPGQKWKIEIQKAIRKSSFFLTLLSTNSVNKRGFVQKEIKEALSFLDEIPESEVYIIPVRLDECEPSPYELHHYQWVDLFKDYNKGIENILRVVRSEREKDGFVEEILEDQLTQVNVYSFVDSVFVLMRHRDRYTPEHCKGVSHISSKIGAILGLSKEEIKLLSLAAVLHDIGKLAAPDLFYTSESVGINHLFDHSVIGSRALEVGGFPDEIVTGVLHHHEMLDGSGYPNGLSGENIPLISRIIAVTDAFHAAISRRSYRTPSSKPYSIDQAFAEIKQQAGIKYDYKVVNALVELSDWIKQTFILSIGP